MGRKLGPIGRWRGSIGGGIVILVIMLAQPMCQHAPSDGSPRSTSAPVLAEPRSATAGTSLRTAFDARTSDVWVETSGRVLRLLDDDADTRDGSDKHQRFLVQTDDGVTVLVAHNLSAANRVPAKAGDRVMVRGEYEWNDKGGTIHFTHAPKYRTKDASKSGWIEHAGKKYE